MTTPEVPKTIIVICDDCGKYHVGEYDHDGRFGEGPIYAVVCLEDWLTGYYTLEAALTDAETAKLEYTVGPMGITVPVAAGGVQ